MKWIGRIMGNGSVMFNRRRETGDGRREFPSNLGSPDMDIAFLQTPNKCYWVFLAQKQSI